jgi:2-amino-4-hydroxy-6-hydroxymethyldihydropteridine diphosphokinase
MLQRARSKSACRGKAYPAAFATADKLGAWRRRRETLMILIGLGSNLATRRFGGPRANCEAALAALESRGVAVSRRSSWYRSRPVPPSDQPWFVNGVAEVETALGPEDLLQALHEVEAWFGRRRRERNEARVIDLDLLVYHDVVSRPGDHLVLPHPRITERAFVLVPLAELAPDWRHPINGLTARELVARLPSGQAVEVIDET